MAAAPLALTVVQMILAAEPAVVTAIHNLLSGKGTADDLTVLKADALAWQAIADKAAAEIAKAAPAGPTLVPAAAPAPESAKAGELGEVGVAGTTHS